jgi:hypothetical protein
VPQPEASASAKENRSLKETLIGLAASWGRLTHQLPVRLARRIAVKEVLTLISPRC